MDLPHSAPGAGYKQADAVQRLDGRGERFVRYVLVVVAVFLPLAAPASQTPSAWDLVHPRGFDWQDRDARAHLADDLLGRIQMLAAVIPPISANDLERVRREQAELDALGDAAPPRRLSRHYLSRRYQHSVVLELLENTQGALGCAARSERITAEMACWARASAYLLQEERLDLGLNVLRQARMLPRDEDMPVKAQDPVVWYGEYGRGVLNHILIPYLESRAAGGTP